MSQIKVPAPPGAVMPEVPVMAEAEIPTPPKPVSPKKKIEVIATREGFIFNERKLTGAKFEVERHQLGSWMKCKDPIEEAAHLDRMRAKKKAANAKGIADHEAELAADA